MINFSIKRFVNIKDTLITIFGSSAVAGKILLVTNACWTRDCWDVPGSSNGVFEGNIAKSGYKKANNKTAKLQNGEITKR